MQIQEIPLFNSIIHDVSGRKIDDNYLSEGLNVLFEDGYIKDRYGLSEFLASVPDPIKRINLFKRMFSDSVYIVVFTTKDIYYYDTSSVSFKYITRRFNNVTASSVSGVTVTPTFTTFGGGTATGSGTAGTKIITLTTYPTGLSVGMAVSGANVPNDTFIDRIETKSGASKIYINNTIVTGIVSATLTFSWKLRSTEWNRTNTYKIGFGSTDPNLVASNMWFNVASVNGLTTQTITLVAGQTGVPASGVFCLRLCYSGDEDNMWQVACPYSAYHDENIMLATNGIDDVQEWSPTSTVTGYCIDYPEYTNICKAIGYWGTIGNGHIIASSPYDTTTGYYNINAIEISDPIPSTEKGALESYTPWSGAYSALYDETSGIVGVLPLGDTSLVIYKPESISMAIENPNYTTEEPFIIKENVKRSLGVPCIDVVSSFESYHLFFSGDNIYAFDGINENALGDGNVKYILSNINKNYQNRSFCLTIKEKNLYILFIPTKQMEVNGVIKPASENPDLAIVFDYVDKSYSFWRFKDDSGNFISFTSQGLFINQFAPIWGSFLFGGAGTRTNGSEVITGMTSTTGIVAGMHVTGTGIPAGRTIATVDSGTQVTLNSGTSVTASTVADLKIGWYPSELPSYRWADLKVLDNFTRIALGSADGYVYEISEIYHQDNTYPIESNVTTKDYELNKGLTFLFSELIVRIALRETSLGFLTGEQMYVRASMDYGRSWSSWVTLALDPATDPENYFMEKKAAFHIRGKALRLQFKWFNPFKYESCFVKWNPTGKEFKYNR